MGCNNIDEYATKVADIPGKDDLALYRKGRVFYLSNDSMSYLGHIEITVSGKVGMISSSSSNIKGGFYNIMFTTILTHTDIDEIRSDVDLSDNAVKSYINLSSTNKKLIIRSYKNSKYDILSKDILEQPGVVASVVLKDKQDMKEHFDKVRRRINGDSVTYKHLKETRNKWLDMVLFYEEIDL